MAPKSKKGAKKETKEDAEPAERAPQTASAPGQGAGAAAAPVLQPAPTQGQPEGPPQQVLRHQRPPLHPGAPPPAAPPSPAQQPPRAGHPGVGMAVAAALAAAPGDEGGEPAPQPQPAPQRAPTLPGNSQAKAWELAVSAAVGAGARRTPIRNARKRIHCRSPFERNLRVPRGASKFATSVASPRRTRRRLRQEQQRPLDGFALISACGADDPAKAVEGTANDAGFAGVVAEDLEFFTALEFLELGGNCVELADLAPLGALQELHLHCNRLSSISVPPAAFPCLQTLNLSYNGLRETHFAAIAASLPTLVRLDLSWNPIRRLPTDLTNLSKLRQLALETCELTSESTFFSLATLEALQEVNLNGNLLSHVPDIELNGALSHLGVIGLAACRFTAVADLVALAKLPALRRVVLWGNPIERRSRDIYTLQEMLGEARMAFEGPLPPKRRVADFYTAAAARGEVRKVRSDLKLLRPRRNSNLRTALPITGGPASTPAAPPHQLQPALPPPEAQPMLTAPEPEQADPQAEAERQMTSFFLTEGIDTDLESSRRLRRAEEAAPMRRSAVDTPDTVSTVTGGRWRWQAPPPQDDPVARCPTPPDERRREIEEDMRALLERPATPDAALAAIDAVFRDPSRRPRWAGVRSFENPPPVHVAVKELRMALAFPMSFSESAALRNLTRRKGPREGQRRSPLPPPKLPPLPHLLPGAALAPADSELTEAESPGMPPPAHTW
eukprot:TRINITY_DN5273_c2_g1_i1.p1 TRINITY_DN5273_c2_g1~~TRINITY_DN5273_c2_g1_i1.p1  ORF type:complete len:760 (+),score=222.03 TRINITY_DN5273_c2_g1_i1:93-2282(+)